MTARSRPRPGNTRWALVTGAVMAFVGACREDDRSATPDAEFIIAAGDSSYWVRSDASGMKFRGSPLVLARIAGRFLELYVVDDDQSFENALFVGQRLYHRDLLSGDSTEIFRDTAVSAVAARYQRLHPNARRIEADEDVAEEPDVSATAEISVLGVHGPFLSIEYHVDTTGSTDDAWHATRHVVLDLRTGRPATLADVLGGTESSTVLPRASSLYAQTIDSVRADRRPAARRAARAIGQFRFDPTSFSLTAPNGRLMVAFSAPGQGSGGEGFVLPMPPIPVSEPPWWAEARATLPTTAGEREEQWSNRTYTLKAVYDTLPRPVRLSLVDSAQREIAIASIASPIHRVYWLDNPPIDAALRGALTRAFDEAALYDESARTAGGGPSTSLSEHVHVVPHRRAGRFRLASNQ